MKKTWTVGVILSFLSVTVGFSAPLSDEALAAILDQSTGAACPQLQEPKESLLPPDQLQGIQYLTCSATATCSDTSPGTPISCNWGGSGGSCTFQNQNCASGVRGQVNCNGTITQCPTCPTCNACCQCASTSSCFSCCRCAGGTIKGCMGECGDI